MIRISVSVMEHVDDISQLRENDGAEKRFFAYMQLYCTHQRQNYDYHDRTD